MDEKNIKEPEKIVKSEKETKNENIIIKNQDENFFITNISDELNINKVTENEIKLNNQEHGDFLQTKNNIAIGNDEINGEDKNNIAAKKNIEFYNDLGLNLLNKAQLFDSKKQVDFRKEDLNSDDFFFIDAKNELENEQTLDDQEYKSSAKKDKLEIDENIEKNNLKQSEFVEDFKQGISFSENTANADQFQPVNHGFLNYNKDQFDLTKFTMNENFVILNQETTKLYDKEKIENNIVKKQNNEQQNTFLNINFENSNSITHIYETKEKSELFDNKNLNNYKENKDEKKDILDLTKCDYQSQRKNSVLFDPPFYSKNNYDEDFTNNNDHEFLVKNKNSYEFDYNLDDNLINKIPDKPINDSKTFTISTEMFNSKTINAMESLNNNHCNKQMKNQFNEHDSLKISESSSSEKSSVEEIKDKETCQDNNESNSEKSVPEQMQEKRNQKNLHCAEKTKNQVAHSYFENFCEKFFLDINEAILEPTQINIKKTFTKEISKKEKMISSLIDFADLNQINISEKYVKIRGKSDNEFNDDVINKFFKENEIEEEEIEHDLLKTYKKQIEINNLRKSIILKVMQTRMVYRSFLNSVRILDDNILKLYIKRIKNKKKYKNEEFFNELKFLIDKKKEFIKAFSGIEKYKDFLYELENLFCEENVNTKNYDYCGKDYFK